jgi:hypothetical protein
MSIDVTTIDLQTLWKDSAAYFNTAAKTTQLASLLIVGVRTRTCNAELAMLLARTGSQIGIPATKPLHITLVVFCILALAFASLFHSPQHVAQVSGTLSSQDVASDADGNRARLTHDLSVKHCCGCSGAAELNVTAMAKSVTSAVAAPADLRPHAPPANTLPPRRLI